MISFVFCAADDLVMSQSSGSGTDGTVLATGATNEVDEIFVEASNGNASDGPPKLLR